MKENIYTKTIPLLKAISSNIEILKNMVADKTKEFEKKMDFLKKTKCMNIEGNLGSIDRKVHEVIIKIWELE